MHKKAQSTVEYILLVAAVIAVAIIFLGPGGLFQSRLNTTLNQVSGSMLNVAARVTPP